MSSSETRLLALLGLLVAAVLATVLLVRGGSSSSGEVGEGPPKATKSVAGRIDWPQFGRVPERTHYLPAEPGLLDPPLKPLWTINTHALIEFPPALHAGVAYVINKYGNGKAVRVSDRKVLWEINIRPSDKGKPNFVTAPVYYEGKVYGAFLDGHLAAGVAKNGHQAWVKDLHAHLESSPLAVDGSLYLGTDTHEVVALRASDGKTRWVFHSPAAIKASPSYHDGRVFVADYESGMFALDPTRGKLDWHTNTSKVAPYGKGGFFSSPAVAYGRVYAARDDGTVFAFDEKTGKVDWSFPTNNFIYGSPAVARVPGTPPSVYIGSYDEHLYALDARSGQQRWRYDIGGPVPGTSTVIGHTVYASSFKTRETIGVDARSHRKTFELKQAGYTPMVSDGRRLYLIGYYELIGLQPTKP